jgi:hypothetical protein
MRQFYSFLSVLLAATLTIPPITAQTPLPPSGLQVRLQSSDAAALPVNSNGYTLLVVDANGAPVAGAAVALRMPDDGPSGTFADGKKTLVAYTDSKGLVRFQRIHWNGSAGIALVRVTVVKAGVQTAVLIRQSLLANPDGTALASAKPASAPAPPSAGTAVASAKTSPAPPQGTVVAPFGPPASSAVPMPTPGTQTAAALPAAPPPPVPGTPVSATLQSPGQTASAASPSVSVTDTSGSTGGTAAHNGISKKWILLAVVAAGAGVGVALAMSGHGSTPTAAGAGLTIGTPTLSIGH